MHRTPTPSLPLLTPRLMPVRTAWLDAAGVELALLRLDRVHPLIGGNKGYKLQGFLTRMRQRAAHGLISLGGPHSNHLHALAAAGRLMGFATVGLLRGEPQDTPTVRDLQELGMQLHWLGYGGYRQRHHADFWDPWRRRYPDLLPVPEGAGSLDGAVGCRDLVETISPQLAALGWDDYDQLWVAVGSGATLAGLALGTQRPLVGALAVPASYGVQAAIEAILDQSEGPRAPYRLLEAARSGFGRLDAELLAFIHEFEAETAVALDPCYTAKLLYRLREEVRAGRLAAGSRLVALHTGGLQGRRAAGLAQLQA